MEIQEDLVWDKYSGELIGFADLGNINTNYAVNVEKLAGNVQGTISKLNYINDTPLTKLQKIIFININILFRGTSHGKTVG